MIPRESFSWSVIFLRANNDICSHAEGYIRETKPHCGKIRFDSCVLIGCAPNDPPDSQDVSCHRGHIDHAVWLLQGFHDRFYTNSYASDCVSFEVAITVWCDTLISPILWLEGMELILKAAEGSTGPSNLGSKCCISPLKAFTDYAIQIWSYKDEACWMLECLATN